MDTPEEDSTSSKYIENITIPSALISKTFGESLKKSLSSGEMVNVNLDWRESVPHPDDELMKIVSRSARYHRMRVFRSKVHESYCGLMTRRLTNNFWGKTTYTDDKLDMCFGLKCKYMLSTISIWFPRLYVLAADQHAKAVEYRNQSGWDIPWRIPLRSGILQEQAEHLLLQLATVHLQGGADAWCWDLGHDGLFSVKEARIIIDRHVLPEVDVKVRWCRFLPRKVNVFLWRLRHNRLPTRWMLGRRGINLPNIMCPVCDGCPEQTQHLFCRCNVARDLWNAMGRWCQIHIPAFADIADVWNWMDMQAGTTNRKTVMEVLIGTLLWVIWTFRNAVVFGDGSYRKNMIFDNFQLFAVNGSISITYMVSKPPPA
ncbi:hypothetical protein LXL04_037047 [Taraxacum kok-saghyz]